MGAVSTCPAFLDALCDALVAREGLVGVNVYTAPVDHLALGQECIVFAVEAQTADYEFPTVPMRETFEEYQIEGRTWVLKHGAGEDAIRAARDRAFEILEQVHDYLDSLTSTPATQTALGVDDARIVGWNMEQFPGDGYRDCRLAFNIRVRARFTPSA